MKSYKHKFEKVTLPTERACWFIGALFLLFGAAGGPDYLRYLDWGWAFAQNDIFRLESDLASPVGLPLFQWSHGPGLFYALPAFVHRFLQNFSPLAASILGDSLISGWIAVLILWWSFNKLLRDRLGASTGARFFWIGITFLGTHMGYYSISHGSESLILGCLSLLAFWTIPSRTWRKYDVITAAMLAACLVIIRNQLTPFALLGMVLAFYRYQHSTSRTNFMKSWAAILFTVGIIFAVAAAQILLVNYWMTGSPFGSTHAFGDGLFKSLDFSNPEILAVLFHPWHGLFIYHPFYLIGIFALIRRVILAPAKAERRFFMALSLVIALHIYLHAAWYCWWLGLGTFGMRGLSVLSLILPIVVIDDYRSPGTSIRLRFFYTRGAVLCALWSYLLMVQGDTNLMTYKQLLTAQWQTFCTPATASSIFVSICIGFISLMFARKKHQHRPFEVICAGGMLFLVLSWLFISIPSSSIPLLIASGIFVIALLCIMQGVTISDRGQGVETSSAVYTRIRFSMLACFMLISIIFLSFSFSTYDYIRGHKSAPRTFSRQSRVYYPEVWECYSEYLRVSGFDDKKEWLRRYLLDIR